MSDDNNMNNNVNNDNNSNSDDDSKNSGKFKTRKNKKEFYFKERAIIIEQLLSLIDLNDTDNSILLIELQNNELLKNKIVELSENIKKYYKCSSWGYFVSLNNNQKGDEISLFKAILKDHDYSIFSKNIICEHNNIKKRYTKLYLLNN